MKKSILLSALVATTALAACNTGDTQRATPRVTGATQQVDASLSRLGSRNPVRAGGAQFNDGIFVGATPERNSAAMLPGHVQGSGAISLVSRDAMTAAQIAQRLSEITGIPHVLALGPTGRVVQESGVTRSAGDISIPPLDMNGGPPPVIPTDPAPSASIQTASSDMPTMRPDLRGSLSEVLDQIANAFDLEWTYADGRVLMRDYVTRKYQISALPTTSNASATIAANDISSASATTSDVWSEVRETLAGIVGEGASMAIGQTTGVVTITAKISNQDRVAEYIKQLNGTVGQQVSFDVNVLTVSLDEADSYGLDLSAAFRSSDFSGSINTGSNTASSAGSVNIGIISGNVNINAIANALSRQGRVSVATRAGATTSNNRVAPIQVTDTTGYISGYEVTQNSNTNSETIKPQVDEVETGFQMQLFPRVLNNREIMVQYTVRLSELNNMRSFGEGSNLVQMPEVSTTSFEQQAVLENGQTLVLAGFERQRAEFEKTNNNGLFGFGAGETSRVNRVATVMLITPRIIGRAGR